MAKLSDDESKTLEALLAKRDAKDDDDRGGRRENISYTIDLSDEGAVKRAMKLGLLTSADLEDDDDGDDDDDDAKGKGKSKSKDDDDDDDAPRRRMDRRYA